MGKLARNLSLVSGFTILSRLLGLLRDILFFSFFGSSAIASAFILAFTLPNLFRRMLGEGTLSSAFIPVYSESLQQDGLSSANRILNQVLSRLFILLLCLSALVCGLSALGGSALFSEKKWLEGAFLNSIVFPYVLFICLSAILVGALNTHRSFFAGAFSPIILNFMMIGSLVAGKWVFDLDGMELAMALGWGVVAGGVFQLLMPAWQLRIQKSWKWRLDLTSSPQLSKIKALFWVGALGAAVAQVNVLVSRLLAYSLDDQGALPYLFLSARLIELPLGVFAIAVSTVLFPELARSSSSKDKKLFDDFFAKGFRLTLAVILPAAIGLGLLAEPILSVLFQYGEFVGEDVILAAGVLKVSVIALPLYALCSYMIKSFHARKEMKPPLFAGIASFCINLFLCLLLMEEFGVYGLAWANVGAAFAQLIFLLFQFKGMPVLRYLADKSYFIFGSILSSVAMGWGILFFNSTLGIENTQLGHFGRLFLLIPLGALFYFMLLLALGFPEARYFFSVARKRLRKLLG